MFTRFALVFALFSLAASLEAGEARQYVGSATCQSCHQAEHQRWQGSHHDMAMRHAAPDAVLGDFNDATVTFAGQENRFYRQGDSYWVKITDAAGKLQDYQISYTFGFFPLQQYMVAFPDGKVQLIPFAWDSRPEAEGGQRWFHLYPDLTPQDEFFWTNKGQNWNHMCADCHSTALEKNYDVATDSYQTRWQEINVGCEACHGPASRHVAWHQASEQKPEQPAPAVLGSVGITACAQCHSRRLQLNETDFLASGDLMQRYLPALINAELYHDDGQIYDENYVYGSFLQSKMARAGVTCLDCHDPHSATLKLADSNAICAQCHQPDNYQVKQHHGHINGKPGSNCVDCHMPETVYMQVDPRRDHSFQIPRPDLSEQLGTPNACIGCHAEQSNAWAQGHIKQWHPDSARRLEAEFASTFFAADLGMPNAEDALARVAQDHQFAPIIRGSALERLQRYPGRNALISLARGARHDNSWIRLGAVRGVEGLPPTYRWELLAPLLSDPVLSVRMEAGRVLVGSWSQLTLPQREQLRPAVTDYLSAMQYNADRGFANTNLGNTYRQMGMLDKAEAAYRSAIRIEPIFSSAYVNLADLYRIKGNEQKGVEVLKQGLIVRPESADLHYSLGLTLYRQQQLPAAQDHLRQAHEFAENNGQYTYVYGLFLQSTQPAQAAELFRQAYDTSGDPRHLYALCELLVNQGQQAPAQQCLDRLQKRVPSDVTEPLRRKLTGS